MFNSISLILSSTKWKIINVNALYIRVNYSKKRWKIENYPKLSLLHKPASHIIMRTQLDYNMQLAESDQTLMERLKQVGKYAALL